MLKEYSKSIVKNSMIIYIESRHINTLLSLTSNDKN